MEKTRQEIKTEARNLLGNSIFGEQWLYMLLILFIQSLILGIGGGGSRYSYGLTTLVPLLLGGPLAIGVLRVVIAVVKGVDKKASFEKLFSGFDDTFIKSFLHNLIKSLFLLLWFLLFVIPGIIKSYSYALSYYYQNDDMELDPTDCITKSKEVMVGHKMDLFILDLSFLGWYLLGALCLGVGIFFVMPYHITARTIFLLEIYEQNKLPKKEKPQEEPAKLEEKVLEEPKFEEVQDEPQQEETSEPAE